MSEEVQVSAVQALEQLYDYRVLLGLQKAETIRSVIPAEVQEDIEGIEAEYASKEAVLAEKIAELEVKARAEALAAKATVDGAHWQVVYKNPGVSVSAKDVEALANRYEIAYPTIASAIRALLKPTKESTAIQPRRGG